MFCQGTQFWRLQPPAPIAAERESEDEEIEIILPAGLRAIKLE